MSKNTQVIKVLNDYILVKEVQVREEKSKILLVNDEKTQMYGEILKVPDDMDALKPGDRVAFHSGTGIPSPDGNYLVHLQNIMWRYR